MVQGHSSAPEIHSHPKCLLLGLAKNRPLIHVRMQILLSPVDGDELLIVVQLTGSPEVGQFVDALPLPPHEAHDVPGLDVAVDDAILPQVVHASRHTAQHHQELLLRQPEAVLRALQHTQQAPTGAVLHHQHLLPAVPRLLHGKELDDVRVVQLPQDLKLPPLHLSGSQVAGGVEDLHSNQLPGFLVPGLVHTGSGPLPQQVVRVPQVIDGAQHLLPLAGQPPCTRALSSPGSGRDSPGR